MTDPRTNRLTNRWKDMRDNREVKIQPTFNTLHVNLYFFYAEASLYSNSCLTHSLTCDEVLSFISCLLDCLHLIFVIFVNISYILLVRDINHILSWYTVAKSFLLKYPFCAGHSHNLISFIYGARVCDTFYAKRSIFSRVATIIAYNRIFDNSWIIENSIIHE